MHKKLSLYVSIWKQTKLNLWIAKTKTKFNDKKSKSKIGAQKWWECLSNGKDDESATQVRLYVCKHIASVLRKT